jgi:SAM-dependent methyltransferase
MNSWFEIFAKVSIREFWGDGKEPQRGFSVVGERILDVLSTSGDLENKQKNDTNHRAGFCVERMVGGIERWVVRRNQFVVIGAAERKTLKEAVTRFWDRVHGRLDLDRELVRKAAVRLEADLRGWIRQLGEANVSLDFVLSEPVCAQYSPQLQLGVLGLSLESLKEPILDLGCGAQGRLVRYLRSAGLDALGVDRQVAPAATTAKKGPKAAAMGANAAAKGPKAAAMGANAAAKGPKAAAMGANAAAMEPKAAAGVQRGDWFDFPFGQKQWGTIISHMSFSTHFLHHHNRPQAAGARCYAERYMEVLRALRSGGVFAYAPGLPFIERLLARERFQVRQKAIASQPRACVSQHALADVGAAHWYATQVCRLA